MVKDTKPSSRKRPSIMTGDGSPGAKPAGKVQQGAPQKTAATILDQRWPLMVSEAVDGALIGGSDNGSSKTRIERELRNLLGNVPKTNNLKGFLASLNAVITLKEVQGHTEWDINPRATIGLAEIGGGGISATQAILMEQALPMIVAAKEKIQNLVPLTIPNEQFDPKEIEARRQSVLISLSNFEQEICRPQGIRPPRAAQLLKELDLSSGNIIFPLATMGTEFGFVSGLEHNKPTITHSNVNTQDEDKALADFAALQLLLTGVADAYFKFANDKHRRYLGDVLWDLSRHLAAVKQCLDDVIEAMDSVFLESAHRELLFIQHTTMTVADLLDWVDSYVTREAAQLIDVAGRIGIDSVRVTLVDICAAVTNAKGNVPDDRFAAIRVQDAWKDLVTALNNAVTASKQSYLVPAK